MKAIVALLVSILATAGDATPHEPSLPTLLQSIPLPGVEGRIDHICLSADKKWLYLAALGNNTLEVIDLEAGKPVHQIQGLEEPQGVLFVSNPSRIVVSNGGNGKCQFFNAESFKLLHTTDLGTDADNLRLDAPSGKIYAGCKSGALAVLDIESGEKVGEILLDGHPEAFEIETKGKRIFVNVPGAEQIAVIDREKCTAIAKWPMKDAKANYPMALDESRHRLFVGCRKPSRLVVLDTESGRSVSVQECSGDPDDVFFDAASKRLYLSCGEGFLDVFEQKDADHYARLTQIPTAVGARTSLFAPDLGLLFLAVPHRGEQKAELRVFKTSPSQGGG